MWENELAKLNATQVGWHSAVRRFVKKGFCGLYREGRDIFAIARRVFGATVALIKFTFL